ncbi:MAG: DNA internalization-related competence protein ComEC/Rec2 [Mogibacterium sp.]|nr:DNA internalization-related competence protein ComEC/Rec2 [Mogibacterium sp.]
MLRRKLTSYTLLYIAGITAGFFMFERSRITESAAFCAAVIAAVLFTDPGVSSGVFPKKERLKSETYNARHLDLKREALNKQKTILLIFFLTGFLLIAFRSMSYNDALTFIHGKNYIRGRVCSVSVKNDKIRMIVKNSKTGPSKVLVTLDKPAAQRAAELAGSHTAEAFVRSGAYGYIGANIEARGKYSEIPSADNPGCFDYSLYMKSRGVTVQFEAYILEVTDSSVSAGTRIKCNLYDARESFISRFDDDTQGFIRGVIFGDKTGIDENILEEFNNNSTGHILAVSGLHIGFLYGLLRLLTTRRRTLPVSVLIIAVILLYGEMTMWSPATVRACIVLTISLCSTHFRRRSDLLTSISLAAFLILTFQPYQLFNSGFQLSFLALSGIAFFTGPVSSLTGEALGVMFAVQMGTMPVIAYSFCRINPLSILINVPVILLASVLVPVCILMLMLEAGTGSVPETGIKLAELISYAVLKINHLLSFGGSFSIKTAGPGAAAIIVIYILIFGLASEWTRVMLLRRESKAILKQGILLLMPLAMLFSCMYEPISDDEIVFVAVGQGDCTHIRAEGHDVLIDGGGQTSYGSKFKEDKDKENGYNTGENILMPYLMHSNADAVEIALVTHLHADHYKGIDELSEVFPVGAIGVPIDYRDSLDKGDLSAKIILIRPDSKVDITDDVSIEVIWPVEASEEPIAADDPNEHNMVYMIHYKDIKVMVTGDLLEADEKAMIEYYRNTDTLKCDILKVAHHGSKSSSSEAFLDAASPRLAVIQCGRNNFYGHPHKQTLERLEERNIKVFRTDLNGAVGIDIKGNHSDPYFVDCYKNKDD